MDIFPLTVQEEINTVTLALNFWRNLNSLHSFQAGVSRSLISALRRIMLPRPGSVSNSIVSLTLH